MQLVGFANEAGWVKGFRRHSESLQLRLVSSWKLIAFRCNSSREISPRRVQRLPVARLVREQTGHAGGVQGRHQMKASILSAAIAADPQQIPRLPSYTTCGVCHLHTFTKRDG